MHLRVIHLHPYPRTGVRLPLPQTHKDKILIPVLAMEPALEHLCTQLSALGRDSCLTNQQVQPCRPSAASVFSNRVLCFHTVAQLISDQHRLRIDSRCYLDNYTHVYFLIRRLRIGCEDTFETEVRVSHDIITKIESKVCLVGEKVQILILQHILLLLDK